MSLSNGLKNAGKYKDLIILLDESTSIKVSNHTSWTLHSYLGLVRLIFDIRVKVQKNSENTRLTTRLCNLFLPAKVQKPQKRWRFLDIFRSNIGATFELCSDKLSNDKKVALLHKYFSHIPVICNAIYFNLSISFIINFDFYKSRFFINLKTLICYIMLLLLFSRLKI